MTIEGLEHLEKDGWELVRIGTPKLGVDTFLADDGTIKLCNFNSARMNCAIIRRIEKPKQYRPFANAAEYVANRREGFAVDWNFKDSSPGFYAVVGANDSFLFVAFGEVTRQFDWSQAFEKLMFRHTDNTTSPFGVEVQS